MRGSLAPDGGIIKMGLRWDRPLKVTGRAKTFSAWEQAFEALKAGKIQKGDVVVLRGIGVKGGPGMGMASRIVFALDGAGLGPDVPVVTDGQLSGLVNKGLVVGEVTPEAAIGGPLGLVEDGDAIIIDVEKRAPSISTYPPPRWPCAASASSRPPRMPTTAGSISMSARCSRCRAAPRSSAGSRHRYKDPKLRSATHVPAACVA